MPRARQPLPESFALHRVPGLFDVVRPPLQGLLSLWQRIDVSGRETMPEAGPLLVLANHVTWFDALTLMAAMRRPIRFLRPRGEADPDRDLEEVLGIFPEGERTWDGRLLPLVPGVGRQVRDLDLPVVTARIVNGYRQDPRWAARPRHGRVKVELDPPRRLAEEAPEAIEADLARRLSVDPEAGSGWPVRGRHLAEGVENVLFRCPSCGMVDGLVGEGDGLRCQSCRAAWTMDPGNLLHPSDGGEVLHLPALLAELRASVARGEAPDSSLLAREGVLLRSEPMRLLDLSGGETKEIARGRLELTPGRLRVEGGPWQLSLDLVDSIHVVERRRLLVRSGAHLYEVVLPRESVVKWQWVGTAWQAPAPRVAA